MVITNQSSSILDHKVILNRLTFLLLFIFLSNWAIAQKAIPELWGQRIHDDAHVLKQETIDTLEQRLKVYEDSTSNQIAILTIQSLDGEVIEEYSLKPFRILA